MELKFILTAFFTALIGYLLGSISFAIIISKLFGKTDIRTIGSGNAGVSNILRAYGFPAALITALGDFMKAGVAAYIGTILFAKYIDPALFKYGGYLAGIFALVGHIFPLYFGFKGGKAVMSTVGVIFVMSPTVAVVMMLAFIVVAFGSRYMSLGSIVIAIIYPIGVIIANKAMKTSIFPDIIFSLLMTVMILYLHRANIKRLLKGEETKLDFKKKAK